MSYATPGYETRRDTALALVLVVAIGVVAYTPAPIAFAKAFGHELLVAHGPRLQTGLVATLKLVGAAMVLGALLSVPLTLARRSRNRLLAGAAAAYVAFFRGTPLLAQAFLAYYGAGQFRETLEAGGLWWIFRDAWTCVILTFALNTAAYQVEIWRGAIDAVPKGQAEAARALGLSRPAAFLTVVAPQAALLGLRPFGNEVVLMIKGSAVASIVTVLELMGSTRLAFSRSFDFEIYLWAGAIYLLLVETTRRLFDLAERRLAVGR